MEKEPERGISFVEYMDNLARNVNASQREEEAKIDLALSLDSLAFCAATVICAKSDSPADCVQFYMARLSLHVGKLKGEREYRKAQESNK